MTAEREADVEADVPAVRVDWVDLSGVPGLRGAAEVGGRLGMTSLPGDRDPRPLNSGLPPRDLAADVHGLHHDHGADALLLLVEDHELASSGVPDLPEVVAAEGIELLRFPTPDFGVTDDRDGLRAVLDDVLGRVRAGQRVVVACRAGRGRTGTIVACLLRDAGLDADAATVLTRASRTGTIERESQAQFVNDWNWPAEDGR